MTPRHDPILHTPPAGGPAIQWTTVNAAEAFPGVPTQLTWSYCGTAAEQLARGGFHAIGVLTGPETPVPRDPGRRLLNIFWGHVAINLDLFRMVADRIPGSSGDAVESQFFAAPRPGRSTVTSRPGWRRYPFVAGKMPVAAIRARRKLVVPAGHQRWQDSVARPLRSRAEILDRLRDAFGWLGSMHEHAVISMVAQGLWEQVHNRAEAVGKAAVAQQLLADGTGSEEVVMVRDLWAVSRDLQPLDVFLGRHGFHGPAKLELAARSWREDARPLEALVASYRTMDESKSPAALQERQARAAAEGARELLAALPRLQRTPVGRLLSMARTAMRLREAGRVGMLRAADVARHAARALGEDLARAGVLEEPGHVYHLSWDEVTSPPADAGDLIAQRQAGYAWYQGVELPERWVGDVEPIEVAGDDPAILTGIGVSSGVVEGTARVISSPDDSAGLEPGEILVCRTTDPSWATYFLVADGVVIDVGGPLSHGAIVAREMGIPCVINVGCGTRVLKSGDRIRVDGDSGEVIRL